MVGVFDLPNTNRIPQRLLVRPVEFNDPVFKAIWNSRLSRSHFSGRWIKGNKCFSPISPNWRSDLVQSIQSVSMIFKKVKILVIPYIEYSHCNLTEFSY